MAFKITRNYIRLVSTLYGGDYDKFILAEKQIQIFISQIDFLENTDKDILITVIAKAYIYKSKLRKMIDFLSIYLPKATYPGLVLISLLSFSIRRNQWKYASVLYKFIRPCHRKESAKIYIKLLLVYIEFLLAIRYQVIKKQRNLLKYILKHNIQLNEITEMVMKELIKQSGTNKNIQAYLIDQISKQEFLFNTMCSCKDKVISTFISNFITLPVELSFRRKTNNTK